MGGTLRTQNFEILNTQLAFKCKSALQKCHQFCSMVKFVEKTEQNSDFTLLPIIDPKARLSYEILFKKFHPRINLTTLFWTKSYLLNTIKPFSGHENRSLTKSQKTFTRGVPFGT
jgi:hypothetical protein